MSVEQERKFSELKEQIAFGLGQATPQKFNRLIHIREIENGFIVSGHKFYDLTNGSDEHYCQSIQDLKDFVENIFGGLN